MSIKYIVILSKFQKFVNLVILLYCRVVMSRLDWIRSAVVFIIAWDIAYDVWNLYSRIGDFGKSPNQSHYTLSPKQSCLYRHVSQISSLSHSRCIERVATFV